MQNTQAGSERHDDPQKGLWTYVVLGLIIGGLYLLRRHNIKKETEIADEDSPAKLGISQASSDSHLDRIESICESIREQLGSQQRTSRFYILLSLGIAFIVATPSIAFSMLGIEQMKNLTSLSLWILFGGLLIMSWAVLEFKRNYRRNIAMAGTIVTLSGVLILTYPLLFNMTLVPILVGIGWLAIILGLIVMFTAVWSAGNH